MSWYEEPAGYSRLILERRLLACDYPQMAMTQCPDGVIRVSGYLQPEYCCRRYFTVAEYPDSYPYGRIAVMLPNDTVAPGTPHFYCDNSLCVEHGDFWPDDTMCTVLGWTAEWLTLYEDFLRTRRTW